MNFLLVLINSIFALSALSPVVYGAGTDYPQSKLQGMVGFAAQAKVTGGWDGEVVTVITLADLEKCVEDDKSRVCVISSGISASTVTKVFMGANKSIIGSFDKPVLYNIHLRANLSSKNIIFQNLVFQHSPELKSNDDEQLYLNAGQGYWIDHCSFVGHEWSTDDGSLDKHLYIGETADLATISNCYFGNHKYGLILGWPQDGANEYDGLPQLTLANNHYENIEVRSPGLMRYGHYHAYSNYINKYSAGFTVSFHSQILSENNMFENGKAQIDDYANGAFTDTGSVPAITNQKSPKSTLKVTYPYKSIPAEDAKAFVVANAGAQAKELVFGS